MKLPHKPFLLSTSLVCLVVVAKLYAQQSPGTDQGPGSGPEPIVEKIFEADKGNKKGAGKVVKRFDPNQLVEEDVLFPSMTADIIAKHYEIWTGKRVILTNAVMTRGIVFMQKAPFSYREGAQLLEKTCILEGLVFVPSGLGEVKLVVANEVKQQGLDFISEEDLLPQGDEVITYLMKFDHISAQDAQTALASVAGAIRPHGAITVLENVNALIITENSSLIRSLLDVKRVIDVPSAQVQSKMIALEHEDSEKLVEQLQQIMDIQLEENSNVSIDGNSPAPSAPPAPQRGNPAPANPGPTPTAEANNNQSSGGNVKKVNITANTRLNSVFVMGRPIDILFVENLIKMFDEPSSERNFYTYKLNYLPVEDFLPVAESAIRRIIGDIDGSATSAATGGTTRGGTGGTGSAEQTIADQERSEEPTAVLVGSTLLVADNTNNNLIIQGSPQSIEIVKDLIKQMDIATDQVQITAVFGRYTMDGEKSFGADFARVSSNTDSARSFAGNTGTGFPLIASPNSITSPELLPSAADAIVGLALYGQISENFFGFIRALESTNKFELLSRPTLITTNNRKATFSSGQRIAVPTSTLSQATGDTTVSSNTNIEFRDVLLNLEVIPLVNSNDEVTLKISFLNDNVVGSQTINGNSIPTIGTEEIFTTVKVPNNGTIILGGLITENTTDNKSGVPVLSSIPGIGKIFSSTTKNTTKEELVILIQPKIIRGARALQILQEDNREDMEYYNKVTNDLLPKMDKVPTRKTQQNLANPAVETDSPRDRFKGLRR
ncbi:hypothetical protein OAB00_00655 [Akkermansiaceae bacterium]|nr:hypothetical protein [Akkermansiaceae bacterium]